MVRRTVLEKNKLVGSREYALVVYLQNVYIVHTAATTQLLEPQVQFNLNISRIYQVTVPYSLRKLWKHASESDLPPSSRDHLSFRFLDKYCHMHLCFVLFLAMPIILQTDLTAALQDLQGCTS